MGRSSKSDHSDPHQTEKRRLNLEENSPPNHLLHGIMTKHDGMFERRESSGSGSSLVALDKKPFMIGVAGGTASGKSTVCEKLMEKLGQNEMNNVEKQVVHLAQDSFYKELDDQEITKANKGMFNFDHPNAFDNELMESCLEDIMNGKATQIPVYDFKTNS